MNPLGKKTILIASLTLVAFAAAQYFFGILSTKAEVTSLEQLTKLSDAITSGNDLSRDPDISADNTYLVFSSRATNLVSDDTNEQDDIFILNRDTNEIERLSISNDGEEGDDDSSKPSVSGDGRYVAFESRATNLVPGDTNGLQDIFVFDRDNGTLERISVSPTGEQGTADSSNPAVSSDGRYVAFDSQATNLVAGDLNGQADIFVRDLQLNTTTRVSVSDGEVEGDAESVRPVISSDGQFIAFESFATNLVSGDTNGRTDAFVRDTVAGSTERINLSSAGAQMATDDARGLDISSDGRFITFYSADPGLVPDDTNGIFDIFIRDRQLDTTERISVATDGSEAEGGNTFGASVSDDGRYVAFKSYANTLIPDDTNNVWDIFIRDRQLDTTERISVATDGTQSNGNSQEDLVMSNDAKFVFYPSDASNLVEDDTNGHGDLIVWNTELETTEFAIAADILVGWNGNSTEPSISADGNLVVFTSSASNIVPEDTNDSSDVFLYNRETDTVKRISIATDGTEANDESYDAMISANGRYVTFTSGAENLVADDTNGEYDVFVRDLQENITERVSIATDTTEGDSQSEDPSISSDGRYVVFVSDAENLVANDTNEAPDVFVHDRELDITERMSVSSDEEEGGEQSSEPSISGDGRYVTFSSEANNLIENDTNDAYDIFLRDRNTGQTIRVSERMGDSHGNSAMYEAVFTDGDQFIVFESGADNLVEDDTNGVNDIFIVNRATGTIERVSVADDEGESNGTSDSIAATSDGRYVLFRSYADNLVEDDTNDSADLFVRDLVANTTIRVSLKNSDEEASGNIDYPGDISDDGNLVVFSSYDDELVAGDLNGESDIFVRNIALGTTVRASVSTGGVGGNGGSFSPSITADGRYLTFSSVASNLVAGDTNVQADIFVRDLQLNTTVMVTKSFDDLLTDGPSRRPVFSPNGDYIVFASDATNIVSGQDDDGGEQDLFLYKVQDDVIELFGVSSNEEEANSSTFQAVFSENSQFVAFYSYADNLVEGDENGEGDLFIRDISNGTTELVNVSSDGDQGDQDDPDEEYVFGVSSNGRYVAFPSDSLFVNGPNNFTNLYIRDREEDTTDFAIPAFQTLFEGDGDSESPSFSSDGKFIAFASEASNLSDDDNNGETDIFIYSRETGAIELVSVDSEGVVGNAPSLEKPSLSSNGQFVAFYSYADNLVEGDENDTSDVFLHDRETGETILVSKAMDGTQMSDENDDADNNLGFMLSANAGAIAFSSTAEELISGDTNTSSDIFVAVLSGSVPEEEDNDRPRRSGSQINKKVTDLNEQSAEDVSKACIPRHFDAYLRRGDVGAKVIRMQQFLKERGFYTGPVSGYFGPRTEAGVKKFQAQYTKEILIPWKLAEPTGIWGITTRAMANKFDGCSEGEVTLPSGTILNFSL